MKLIIATKNKGKLAEFQLLLAGLPFAITSLLDYPDFSDIEETGTTFAENAAIKAEAVARSFGTLALADDSGLEVDVLHGRPGVYSARYAGPGAGDQANNAKLLADLRGVAQSERTARFQAVIAIARPGHATEFAQGTCEGFVATEPSGSGGFGYDPLFVAAEVNKTFAQMTAEEKNHISHRARAMRQAREILLNIIHTVQAE